MTAAGSESGEPILPGTTIGVLGSGQLGRMFALAARAFGYRVNVFSPEPDSPSGQVCDTEFVAPYEDLDAVREFARSVRAITLEFENVPAGAAEAAAELAPLRPGPRALAVAQHRIREKEHLAGRGIPVVEFAAIRSEEELVAGLDRLGTPAVLKQATHGYDGKGQVRITHASEARVAWKTIAGREAVLEAFVEFEREVSVVAARGADGTVVPFEPIENVHVNHILDTSTTPATLSARERDEALEIAREVLTSLDYVGVLCVEMFVTASGLRVNEIAPRPHNSGHLTIDAHATSQFEQQVRALCGLPLGAPDSLAPAAMANLLGDLWQGGEPHWGAALDDPNVTLHLYGKRAPRPGRKMGHLTALGETAEDGRARVIEARAHLAGR